MGVPFPRLPHWGWQREQRRPYEWGRQLSQVLSSPPHPYKQIDGSIMEERAVTTTNRTNAHSPAANVLTSVTAVSRSTLLPNVVLVAQSPLHLNNFHKYLSNHPDQVWCSKPLNGIEHGMNIGFDDERTSIISDNCKSALDNPEVITEYLANVVAAGHKAGPFTQPPFLDFVGLPMDIVTKKHLFPVKYRIIHDLSWPPQDSINNHIDPDAIRCFSGSFNNAVALIIKHGIGTMSAKLDLADAFKYILVRSQAWPSWAHLVTSRLIYGLSLLCGPLSPLWAAQLSGCVQWICQCHSIHHANQQVQDLLHYLDDYFTVGPPDSPVCASNIMTMIATCKELDFAVNPKKLENLLQWKISSG